MKFVNAKLSNTLGASLLLASSLFSQGFEEPKSTVAPPAKVKSVDDGFAKPTTSVAEPKVAEPKIVKKKPTKAQPTVKPIAKPIEEPQALNNKPNVTPQAKAIPKVEAAPGPTPQKPVEPKAVEKTEEPSSEVEKAEASGESTEKQEASEGFGYSSGGVAVGVLTLDGVSWNRIAWRPEITYGKLGVAFDLELFINSQGQFSSKGWEFDTQEEILNTLYRKIYYIRWAQPGDDFYLRIGALENLTLDAGGLITSGYGNVALYPGVKSLGVHMQLNNIGSLNWNTEAFTNSIEDWQNDGGVLGLKTSFAPLSPLPIPVINDFRIGATWVKDFNQFAAIPDFDNDGCPDRLDDRPKDSEHCVKYINADRLRDDGVHEETIEDVEALLKSDEDRSANNIRGEFGSTRPFAVTGFDALLPIISSDFLSWSLYSAYAFPLDDDLKIEDSFGSIPLGTGIDVSIFSFGLEYRFFQNYFNAGHFDNFYDMERVKFEGESYVTKSQNIWGIDRGVRHGIYGRLGVDLGGVVNVGGSYTHLFSDLEKVAYSNPELPHYHPDYTADRSYSTEASLGKMIVNLIPKISTASVFYIKDYIGQGINDNGNADGFFDLSSNSKYGYNVGVNMGAGMTLKIGSLVTQEYMGEEEGLESRTNFTAETIFTF